jgi:hypothetical protein
MKRNPSRSLSRSLTDELGELRELDLVALKQRWRVLYRREAPARIGGHFCLRPSPTGCRQELSAVSNRPPAAWSSESPKTTSDGDHQPKRPQPGSRRARC